MTTDSRDVTSVLERVLSAYGFTMQKELSEKLGIASNNISSWLKRGSVPASVLVQCAMDTGSDVTWLVTGEFAKSNSEPVNNESLEPSNKALHEKILSSSGKDILDRIIKAYGVTTKKDLAEKLETSPSSVSSWALRDVVPGDIIIKCAMETRCPLHWLMTGKDEFENSHSNNQAANELPILEVKERSLLKGQALYEQVLASGGKAVLERIMQAYGFTMQKELADLLGISTATISTWIRRNYFPGDVVVACALDTKINLMWLALGDVNKDDDLDILRVKRMKLEGGKLKPQGQRAITSDEIPDAANKNSIIYLSNGLNSYLVDFSVKDIFNGTFLIELNSVIDIYKTVILPDNRIRLIGQGFEFDSELNMLQVKGLVIGKYEKFI
ncbi:hypothetical protein EYY83_13065 [Hafnia alvei]|uniref:phage repressor protein CI n=2 Tax=Hafnia alvei TaxID=569 RepID=UPI0010339880|nr:phage repressor protein CI [Hafnia alvei]TBM13023.1 hypothetical protein EYY83_13065 [Hafnia alvei]